MTNAKFPNLKGEASDLHRFIYGTNRALQSVYPDADSYLEFRARDRAGLANDADKLRVKLAYEWDSTPALRAEYVEPAHFIAYRVAESQGAFRTMNRSDRGVV